MLIPRKGAVFHLCLAFTAVIRSSAFQPPKSLVPGARRRRVDSNRPASPSGHAIVSVRLSERKVKDEEESGKPRYPFIARALDKWRNKKGDGSLKSMKGRKSEKANDHRDSIDSEAAVLQALARKTRLEAEKMDLLLTLQKITKIEDKMWDTDNISKYIKEIELLLRKINATQELSNSGSWEDQRMLNTLPLDESLASRRRNHTSESEKVKDDDTMQQILDGDKPILGDDKKDDAISGFEKMPQLIKDMMAKTVGLKDGTNATEVIEKFIAEGRVFEDGDSENFSLIAKADGDDLEEIMVNLDFVEIDSFVKSLLPGVTRKEPVREEYIDVLYSEVLGSDTFMATERKAQAVPGGYLIRGKSKVKPKKGMSDGDALVEAIDAKISNTSLAGKIQLYYILDPTPPSGEEILNDEDELPVLLVTNYDISPDTQPWVKPTVTLLGLASIATFAFGSFSINEAVIGRISASLDSGDGSLDFLYDLSLPLCISVLGTQLVHEAGHLFVAVKDGINIGLPTWVPSLQFGISGCITAIKSSPKNIKSLFDFSISGPLLGLAASFVLLYYGLGITAFMDVAARDQLPGVPVEILRSSALGGGMIDYLLGDGVLNSPDPSSVIKIHPFAIAGFGGLVTNALSLLPIGNTDGGRISISIFGRSFARVVQSTAVLVLVIAGFFGMDDANILICYAIYCQLWQKEPEIPCRNEVDELDLTRGLVAIGIALIVIMTLVPLP